MGLPLTLSSWSHHSVFIFISYEFLLVYMHTNLVFVVLYILIHLLSTRQYSAVTPFPGPMYVKFVVSAVTNGLSYFCWITIKLQVCSISHLYTFCYFTASIVFWVDVVPRCSMFYLYKAIILNLWRNFVVSISSGAKHVCCLVLIDS